MPREHADPTQQAQDTQLQRVCAQPKCAPEHLPAPCVTCTEAGEWLAAEELHARILSALKQSNGDSISLDLTGADYLPGSVLQLMLALQPAPATDTQPCVDLRNVSAELLKWFGYAGASHLLSAGVAE